MPSGEMLALLDYAARFEEDSTPLRVGEGLAERST